MNLAQSATRSASDGAGWRWFHLSNGSILLVQFIDRISLLLGPEADGCAAAEQNAQLYAFKLKVIAPPLCAKPAPQRAVQTQIDAAPTTTAPSSTGQRDRHLRFYGLSRGMGGGGVGEDGEVGW